MTTPTTTKPGALAERDAAVQHAERLAAILQRVADFWVGGDAPEDIENEMRAALAAWKECGK